MNLDRIEELRKELPFDDMVLVDYENGLYGIDIITSNDDADISMVTLMASKNRTIEIDNLIEILNIYKSIILNK
jgi:hypothetical protein